MKNLNKKNVKIVNKKNYFYNLDIYIFNGASYITIVYLKKFFNIFFLK